MASTSDPPASLEAVLERDPMPHDLAVALCTAFKVPGRSGRPSKNNPRLTGDPTGANPDDGKSLLGFITTLVDRRAPGIQSAVFLGVARDSTCVLVHSLFCVYENAYSEAVLWGILGNLPTEDAPTYLRLEPLHFSWGTHFVGVDRLDFESALSGTDPTDGGTPISYAQPVGDLDTDTGSKRTSARGLCLIPPPLWDPS